MREEPLRILLKHIWWNRYHDIARWIRERWCWVVGHDLKWSYNGFGTGEDWCERCWKDEPFEYTLPHRLNQLYGRVAEYEIRHDVHILERFDLWLMERGWLKYMPSWWEY